MAGAMDLDMLMVFVLILAFVVIVLTLWHIRNGSRKVSPFMMGMPFAKSGGVAKKKAENNEEKSSSLPSRTPVREKGVNRDSSEKSNKFTRLRVENEQIDMIRNGKKVVDVRLLNATTRELGAGKKKVLFFSEDDEVVGKVDGFKDYDSLKELLEEEGVEKVLGKSMNIDEAVKFFSWYAGKETEKFRALRIGSHFGGRKSN